MTSNLNLLMNKNMCSSRFKSLNLNLVDMISPLMEKNHVHDFEFCFFMH